VRRVSFAAVFTLLVALLGASADSARACSCARGDPRTALSGADGALIGIFLGKKGRVAGTDQE